jgi:hypothetical protein
MDEKPKFRNLEYVWESFNLAELTEFGDENEGIFGRLPGGRWLKKHWAYSLTMTLDSILGREPVIQERLESWEEITPDEVPKRIATSGDAADIRASQSKTPPPTPKARLVAVCDGDDPHFLVDGVPCPADTVAVHFVARLIKANGEKVSFKDGSRRTRVSQAQLPIGFTTRFPPRLWSL